MPILDRGKRVAKVTQGAELAGLERRVAELEHSRTMLWALEQAAVAMAEASTLDEVLEAIGRTLSPLEINTIVMRLDDTRERLRLAYLSSDSSLVRAVERRVGFTRGRFSVPVDKIAFYRSVVQDRRTEYVHDTQDVARQALPLIPAPVAAWVVERLGMAQMIGAPLIRGDEVWGMVIFSSRQLVADDRAAISVFAHQVGWLLHRIELLGRVQETLAQQQQTQAQLVQSQKMEAMGQLTGGIAHDFNNLLTGIIMAHELALMRLPEDHAARIELDTIGTTAQRAAALVKKLLAFGRRQVLETRNVDVGAVVRDLEPLLVRVLGEDLRLELRSEPRRRAWHACVDVGQLEQVVVNLAVNARDAMPQGGSLVLETANLKRARHPEAGWPTQVRADEVVRLSVRDSGSGIAQDDLPRIFDPFFTTKPVGCGSGLGLSVAHGIVAQHGGWLTVETDPSQGTCFHVWLPRASSGDTPRRSLAATPPRPTHDRNEIRGRKVLVVEDEPSVRQLVARGLAARGVEVCVAESGQAARQVLSQSRLDVVVCDVVLADESGVALCEDFRRRFPDLHIVLVSGYPDERVDPIEIGARGWIFLRKPFSTRELETAITAGVGS